MALSSSPDPEMSSVSKAEHSEAEIILEPNLPRAAIQLATVEEESPGSR